MKLITCLSLLLALPAIDLNSKKPDLPINQIQVIGSHNSYKQAIDPALFSIFKKTDSVSASKIDYEHIPLPAQLNLGLRNLEIDVYADSAGGRYAHPKGLDWAKDQPAFDASGEMKKPGFKVLHIPELDFRSSVPTFAGALKVLRTWSETHADHTPVFITLEAKDDSIKRPGFTSPELFTPKVFDELDKVILENLGKEHIILPDEVRGKYSSLQDAALHQNWPKLSQTKGKFIFVLDAIGKKRAVYILNHPSLKGRVMFTNSDPGTPEAAFMIRNNPKDKQIPEMVKKGYIIRTRADNDTQQARKNDKGDFDAACNSGAQVITTDYYLKSTHFNSDYAVSFAGGKYYRANPLFKSK
ncbi:phosphatidylinositol-specific phospholipase C1-like protein [Pedobacter kyonggii]|uniref:Calcium-dependent phosphoinositide phospholipase C n=1 Tax=Pedobacter kyonggii TaxID=1926871 RepID=A0A4Q9H9M6_9SPHI|nr:phosphatidylinositol-specific phospholipase C1-like protein [Pedobacter kyonggii]TBO40693.1 hypothetical protein EYS08_18020 [Pedobacter kyonggii]